MVPGDQGTTVPVRRALTIPKAFANSAFMKESRGFAIYSGLPDAVVVEELRTEALSLFSEARNQETWVPEPKLTGRVNLLRDRLRQPRRRKFSIGGGPVQARMYQDRRLLRFLTFECGVEIFPSGGRGSYTYYSRPGDFIGLHRDTSYCDLVVITSLEDNSDSTDPSGGLVLYPTRIAEPLDSIRDSPRKGAELVKLTAGQTLVMFGGLVPHRVVPIRVGQRRVISALCFTAVIGG